MNQVKKDLWGGDNDIRVRVIINLAKNNLHGEDNVIVLLFSSHFTVVTI